MTSRRSVPSKQRYAEDPEDRERYRAHRRARYAAHKDEINARRRRKRAENPEYTKRERAYNASRKEERRYYNLERRYGLSVEVYNALLAQQGGACAICRKQPSETLCVDHCGKTRKVRRLLCRKCNFGIGHFDHDPRLLRAAADYLEAFEDDE